MNIDPNTAERIARALERIAPPSPEEEKSLADLRASLHRAEEGWQGWYAAAEQRQEKLITANGELAASRTKLAAAEVALQRSQEELGRVQGYHAEQVREVNRLHFESRKMQEQLDEAARTKAKLQAENERYRQLGETKEVLRMESRIEKLRKRVTLLSTRLSYWKRKAKTSCQKQTQEKYHI